ncbi:hypothetical protein [Leifsonia aquatica]|uniref:Uncharacterized protein n=2 Tax=Leifsonia aquatica TaxID=144185 RepID=U2SZQ8_LEIAQ|nr:hypothetical protein [Leifsonia aquatica]ERK70748.1 hypothetical protein N136_02910 [Leifsonia aquatica ATCC 14665]MBB2965794.1 hypothetical protein [Leifsonia aquatica]
MTIDLTVPGDTAAIRSVADWLDPGLRGAAVAADLELAYVWGDSQTYWTGEAGSAFRDTAQAVRNSTGITHAYLSDAAEVFRAYAGRLERGQSELDSIGRQASTLGLKVHRRKVSRPASTLTYCPAPGESDDRRAYDTFLALVDLYNDVATRVGTWWGETESWVAEHIVPLTVRIDDLNSVSTLLSKLTVHNEDVVQTALEYAKQRTDRDMSWFRQKATVMQADADAIAKGLRSGNPALRAAAEAASPRVVREGLEELTRSIAGVARFSKVIPVAGAMVDVVSAGVELADGGSVSSVGAGLLGGAGGAAAGAALAGTWTLPPVGAAVSIGVGAAAAGAGAHSAWEAWVPLDVREAIDDFLRGSRPALVPHLTESR